jgi:hypothetical protein
MLLVTEIYGIWALGTLAWFSWSRPLAVRPPVTLLNLASIPAAENRVKRPGTISRSGLA